MIARLPAALSLAYLLSACAPAPPAATPVPPSILLVTLDTTRADCLGYESGSAATPNLDALAARGRVFSQAYSTVPTTLPAHASMMTGLYPAGHGLHENSRYLGAHQALATERLRELGYATAAFVSGYPLAAQFGLARGFDHYDDDFAAERAERSAAETTDRALAYLDRRQGPLFLWVHYFDPHDPYEPPEPFRSRFADPYLGEIAFMDRELGRLLEAFESRSPGARILVAGDHGEGRGDHGERLHGNLLYQGVMRVPLIVAGSGVPPGREARAVSIRRVSDTVLAWAGDEAPHGLLSESAETVLGEAMKPYLQYGWQTQVMAVRDGVKVIRSREIEVYDVVADPEESRDLARSVAVDAELREAIRAYPTRPQPVPDAAEELSREDRERLASLGYVDFEGGAAPRPDAPAPRDMTHLFDHLDRGSALFAGGRYEEAVGVFEEVLEEDPHNLMVCVRLGVAHSLLGREREALAHFDRAQRLAPASIDVRHYLAMHHLRSGNLPDAESLFAGVLAESPGRLPALEALARIRERQGRIGEAIALLERVVERRPSAGPELAKLGELQMALGDTPGALAAFERARDAQGDGFAHFLELGVLYLADGRPQAAADSLDRVGPDHPGYPMALFKRAQTSVLLGEPDAPERIRLARERADATTRRLIENEALFSGAGAR